MKILRILLSNSFDACLTIAWMVPLLLALACVYEESEPDTMFTPHYITSTMLGGHDALLGDVDQVGDLDICFKVWASWDQNGNGGNAHAGFLENLSK